MHKLMTLTEILREKILSNYTEYRRKFFDELDYDEDDNEYENDDELDDDDELEDYYEYEDDEFEDEDETEYYIDEVTGEIVFIEDDDESMYCDEEDLEYEKKVYSKVIDNIKNSPKKKIIYLILLEDTYEYIKSKQLNDSTLFEYENSLLKKLEKVNLDNLLEEIDNNNVLLLDLLTIFIEYNLEQKLEDRYNNRKKIELTKNIKYLKKFKIYLLDNINYELNKRR